MLAQCFQYISSRLIIALVLVCYFITACTPEGPPAEELILGKWKLKKAMRNNRITNSLEGMYMKFDDVNAFESNILGDTSTFSSTIDGNRIMVNHNVIKQFEINELSDSIMKLETEINDTRISFVFSR